MITNRSQFMRRSKQFLDIVLILRLFWALAQADALACIYRRSTGMSITTSQDDQKD